MLKRRNRTRLEEEVSGVDLLRTVLRKSSSGETPVSTTFGKGASRRTTAWKADNEAC